MSPSEREEAERVPDHQGSVESLLAELGTYARQGICALADGHYEALPGLAATVNTLGRQLLGDSTPFSRARLEAVCRRLEQSREGPKAKGAATHRRARRGRDEARAPGGQQGLGTGPKPVE
jgi:hypothetical protein